MLLFFIYLLISFIQIIITSSISDGVMKVQEFEKMEKKAKTFACSLLSDSSIISKKKEKKIKEYLKKNNFLKSDAEYNIQEKIKQFKTTICYDNIYIDKANDILMQLQDGNYDFINDKSLSKFFEFDTKSDFKELTKNLKETIQIMEDLRKEEESLHEKRKDDPKLDDSLKDIEKKMFKNPKYDQKFDPLANTINLNSMDITTEREEREKREREKKNKKINDKFRKKNINDTDISFKDIIENPELLRKYIGVKTLIGFIIFMVIITIIDNKNQKRMKEEEEKKMKEKENKEEKKENKEDKEKKENIEENKEDKENVKNKSVDNKQENINKDEIIKEKIE